MSREQLLKAIKVLEKKLHILFVKANGTEIQGRIGLHIAEARLLLDIEEHVDDEGVGMVYDRLVDNYMDITLINSKKKYFIS